MSQSSRDTLVSLDGRFRRASAQRRSGQIDEAERAFRQLAAEYGAGGWPDRQAMATINLAQVLHQRGRLGEARTAFRSALSVAQEIGDDRRVAFCLSGLGALAQEQGDPAAAETHFEDALALFRTLDDPVGAGNQLGNLGLIRQSEGRLEDALTAFAEAERLFALGGNALGAIGVMRCRGELHRRQGEYQQAESTYQRSLVLAKEAGDRLAEANSLRALGQVARAQGRLAEARSLIESGLGLHRELGDVRGELAALIDCATVEFAAGQGGTAIGLLDQCANRARAQGLVTPLARALLNRALYRLSSEQVEAVEADLAEAKPLIERLGDEASLNVWQVTMARTLVRRARWDEAWDVLEGELERATQTHLGAVRAPILGLLGSIQATRGRLAEARELFAESETLYRALGDPEGAGMALMQLARLLAEAGRFEPASDAVTRLLANMATQGDHPLLEAETLMTSAAVNDLMGEYDLALRHIHSARALYLEAKHQIAAVGTGLAEIKYTLRRQREVEDALEPGVSIRARLLHDEAHQLQAPTVAIIADCVLADALQAEGELAEPRTLAERAVTASQRLGFPDGEAQALEVLARVGDDRDTAARAVVVLNRTGSTARAARVVREWELAETEIEDAAQRPLD